ncbi:MAG: tRNA (5-methylaminomethyl-2-thiouridine)(34)-methyltransferase MnmD [Fibrobacter sp.]|nr:tRNA (5-methylaminomethyl-2-thiouridine)(34)-methyltransferase MnmD [Fibrobacter sp.]
MHSPEIPEYLLNKHYNDRYFDVIDAFEEAKYIFIQGNNLIPRLSVMDSDQRVISIGETGFGAGRTLAALIDELNKSDLLDVKVNYNSVELHPLEARQMREILNQVKGCSPQIVNAILEHYSKIDITKSGWHSFSLLERFGSIDVNLWIGEALEMVQSLKYPLDAWFLDGHGPKQNPQMWRTELLSAIGRKTASGGTAATFTVAGQVRRDLTDAGFLVTRCSGIGAKKTVLQAKLIKNPGII